MEASTRLPPYAHGAMNFIGEIPETIPDLRAALMLERAMSARHSHDLLMVRSVGLRMRENFERIASMEDPEAMRNAARSAAQSLSFLRENIHDVAPFS